MLNLCGQNSRWNDDKGSDTGHAGYFHHGASYTFDFSFDYYPQDMILYFTSKYKEKQPFISSGVANAGWQEDPDRQYGA